jgi:hypothetical protein
MNTFFTVRDKFFMQKTLLFLKCFESINEDFRSKLDKTISDQRYKEEIEERLIVALDRFDEPAKAEALFKFFVARINNEIDQKAFMNYLYVLDKIDFHNLETLRKFYASKEEVTSNSNLNSFAFVGLLQLVNQLDIMVFRKNELGSKFLKLLD